MLQLVDRLADLLIARREVLQRSGQILLVGVEVDHAVAREVEQDGFRHAFLLGFQRFADRRGDGVRRLRSRDDALGLGEQNACGEGLDLRHRLRLDQPVLHQLADDRAGSVVAQSPGVNVRRLKIVAQRVHRDQGRESRHVAEVVLEFAAGEFRASFRLHGDHAYLLPLGEILPQEREADAREVAAASETSDHHVRLGVGHLHLRHGLLADDRLVQNHMVQHASQAVARVFRTAQSHLHGLGNGQPEASRTVRIALQRRTARFGQRRG